jgi:GT2 family glycosyltransferase
MEKNKEPLVSIIILNYNGMKFVDKCLTSVLNTKYHNFEVIFVDNASTDGSLEYVKKRFGRNRHLKFVINEKNYGFAKGNNIGVRHAKGEYVVFLNVDTEVDSHWLTELVKVMSSDASIGAAQSKLLTMNDRKRIDACGLMLTPYGFFAERGSGEVDRGQCDSAVEIFAAKGAAMAVKREVLEKVGPFDEDYFIFAEEVDLCWRIWLAGYRVVLVPKSIVFHFGAGIVKTIWPQKSPPYWYKNTLMTFFKNASSKTLLKILPPFLLVSFAGSIKHRKLSSFLKATAEVLAGFRGICKKRAQVQHLLRKVSDEEIFTHVCKKHR